MNLWTKDTSVRKFVLARRFARIAAELMGVKGVRLYHDQALFKEAGGGPTPWHQDQHYWPLATDKTITMWMPLTAVSVEMGPMTFASGSNRFGYLGKFPISDDSQARFEQLIQERALTLTYGTAMAAGDATFHAGWMLHAAPENLTAQTREAMTIMDWWSKSRLYISPQSPGMLNWPAGSASTSHPRKSGAPMPGLADASRQLPTFLVQTCGLNQTRRMYVPSQLCLIPPVRWIAICCQKLWERLQATAWRTM